MRSLFRKLNIGLLGIMLLATPCYADNWYRDVNTSIEKSGMDVPLHIATMATASYYIKKEYGTVPAILVPLLFGTIKELTDKHFSVKDMVANGIGIGIGITIAY